MRQFGKTRVERQEPRRLQMNLSCRAVLQWPGRWTASSSHARPAIDLSGLSLTHSAKVYTSRNRVLGKCVTTPRQCPRFKMASCTAHLFNQQSKLLMSCVLACDVAHERSHALLHGFCSIAHFCKHCIDALDLTAGVQLIR